MNAALDTLPGLRARIAELLAHLRALAEPGGQGGAVLAALSRAEATGGGLEAVREGVRGLARTVEDLQEHLRHALAQAERIEPPPRPALLGSPAYWSELEKTLREAANRSEDAAVSAWLESFAEAFAAWKLDVCERLVDEADTPGARLQDLKRPLSLTIEALRSDDPSPAIAGLDLLLDPHPAGLPRSPLSAPARAAALLVRGRIQLRHRDDDAALESFEAARQASPQDGRIRAALAEYHGSKGDHGAVRDLNRGAITASPDQPDGYVSMALSCENQGWWDEALDWYGQAVDKVLTRAAPDPMAEVGQFLSPVSGALYLCLARAIQGTNPEIALRAIEKAIGLGVKGPGKYPERTAHELKGELLVALGQTREAAAALVRAGQLSLWDGNAELACRHYERASALDPGRARNYWGWSDALFSASFIPKPPWADSARLAKCLEVWNVGTKIELPGEEFHWVYILRAKIAQQSANLPGADRWERSWEAIAFAEQSLLLNPARVSAWVLLGQMHFCLGNDSNALHATETALLYDPEDVAAIDARIITLANLGRYPEARSLLAKRSGLAPAAPGFVSAIAAHLTLYEAAPELDLQAYRDALVLSEAGIAAGATAPWVRVDRAVLLRMLGRTHEARQEYQKLWNELDPMDVDNQLAYAWAGLMAGKDAEMSMILDGLVGDRVAGLSNVQRYLGFASLLHGELSAAGTHLDQALQLAKTARELDAWLVADFETAEVKQELAGRPQAEEAIALLESCKTTARMKRSALSVPASPMEEAERLASADSGDRYHSGWARIGALATTARLNLETGRWLEAVELYRQLDRYRDRFSTVRQGLEQAAFRHGADQPLSLWPVGDQGSHPDADESSSARPGHLARIHDLRVDCERRRPLVRQFGQAGMQRSPLVTPVELHVAPNLERFVKGTDDDLEPNFSLSLAYMQMGIRELLGFAAPLVRVPSNEEVLPDDSYAILLREIPLVHGSVKPNQGLCNETVDRLALLGVEAEEAVNPANGSECAWIDESNWTKVKAAGLLVWTPAEYLVLHLSAVIRFNAAELFDLQMLASLLRSGAEEYYARIASAPGGLSRFGSVLRALLSEQVPIKELSLICERYLESPEMATYELAEQVRCLDAVRALIPGNSPETPIYRLGESLVELITSGIRRDGEAAVLALEPEPTQDALTAVREEVSRLAPTAANPVLFVEDWQIRPFVRKLVELEFPHLAVLSRREALAADSRKVLATIDIAKRSRSLWGESTS
jgi:tetratricopeptide (TPR) repeat protein